MRISNRQLFSLTVFFQIGTTIIYGFSASAGQDAWIATTLSTMIGISIILMYIFLMYLQPGLTLVEWFPAQFGKWLGEPIAWLFPLLFIYEAGRIVADLKDMVPSTILPETPSWAVIAIFILVVAYGIYGGIEVLARFSEICLPIILFMFCVELIMLESTGHVKVENLSPVLEKGWKNIWHSVWPLGITQSFCQTLQFAMIWPLVNHPQRIMKTTIMATILFGILITLADMFGIMVMGRETFQRNIYPLYILLKMVNIGNFISGLDVFGVIYFCITSFFKISIHIYAAFIGIQQLTKVRNTPFLIFPIVIITFILGITMSSNTTEHIQVATKVLPYNLWVPIYLGLPSILLIIIGLKRYGQKLMK
jgi:spore germination protein KB